MNDYVYILIVGKKVRPFSKLKILAKAIGISHEGLEEKLPFEQGSFRIIKEEIDGTFNS